VALGVREKKTRKALKHKGKYFFGFVTACLPLVCRSMRLGGKFGRLNFQSEI
jgi:hypothetical protein